MTDRLSNGEEFAVTPNGPWPKSLCYTIPPGYDLHIAEDGSPFAKNPDTGEIHHFEKPSKEALDWFAQRSKKDAR